MKKLLSLAMILVVAFSLVACGGGGSSSQSGGSSSGSNTSSGGDEKVEIVLWSALAGLRGEALQQVVDNYNASQDKVFVVNEYQGNYHDIAAKVQAALQSGDTPNITMMSGSRMKLFKELGAFVDLTEKFKEHDMSLSDYYDGFTFQLDWGEGQYGVPYNCSTPMFYYNKDMFKEAGLDPEVGPKTWDEIAEFARKVTKDGVIGYEMPLDVWFYECFVMQQGLKMLNDDETDIGFNNADGAAIIYSWIDMMNEGLMSFPPGQEYNSYDQVRQDFSAGKCAMVLCSTGDLGTLNDACDFEVGTCFVPAGKDFGVSGGGTHMCAVVGHDEELDATVDFLKFATSGDQAGLFASITGYIPTSQAAADSAVYKEYLATVPNASTAFEQMKYAYPIPVNTYYEQIKDDVITVELQRIFDQDGYTPEDALNEMSRQTKEILKNGN